MTFLSFISQQTDLLRLLWLELITIMISSVKHPNLNNLNEILMILSTNTYIGPSNIIDSEQTKLVLYSYIV